MAVLSLNTNLSSLRTQRRLTQTTSDLSKTFERLSSGLRVSRAADDAAGLAIASGLNVDSRVFSQGLRNLSDGFSASNIAEGTLNELTNIVLRLQELAEQAANGTLGSIQRRSLDAEVQALSKEYFRIAQTTEFNGLELLNGSVQGLRVQAGYGANAFLHSSLGGKIGTGSLNMTTCTSPEASASAALGDMNGDGILDLVTANFTDSVSVRLGNGDGSFRAITAFVTGSDSQDAALADLNGDGVLDIASVNNASDSVSILLGNGNGTFRTKVDFAVGDDPRSICAGDFNADGVLDLAACNQTGSAISVLLGNGDGTFRARADLSGPSSAAAALGDLNGDGALDLVACSGAGPAYVFLGNGDGSFQARANYTTAGSSSGVSLGDLNGDGILDMVIAASDAGKASVLIGNGDGSFRAKADYAANNMRDACLGDLNGDGILDIVTADYSNSFASVLLGNGDGSFKARTSFGLGTALSVGGALGDLNRDGVLDFVTANDGVNFAVLLGQTQDGVSPLLVFSLKTKANARWALELMKQKLSQLSEQRGTIGANQSRLSTALANLQVARENYDAARSQITDVDVATESAALVRGRILQQGAAAILAQANRAPALALQLLS